MSISRWLEIEEPENSPRSAVIIDGIYYPAVSA